MLDVKPEWLRWQFLLGNIPATKIGRQWRIKKVTINKLIEMGSNRRDEA